MSKTELLNQKILHERELREVENASVEHERELREAAIEHERELRVLTENAVEKARQLQFELYEQRLEAMNQFRAQLTEQASTFLTKERYERDHQIIIDRLNERLDSLEARINTEATATARQDASAQVLSTVTTTNRWLLGIAVTVIIFGSTVLLHTFGIL